MPYLNGRRVASVERFTELSFASSDQQTTIPSELSTAIDVHRMSAAPSSSEIQPQRPEGFQTAPTRSIIKNPNRYQNTPHSVTQQNNAGYPRQQPNQPNFPQANQANFNQPKFNQYGQNQQYLQNDQVYRSTIATPSQSQALIPHQNHKNAERLADVYSNSDDTVQFAGNLRSFINKHIPWMVWIGLGIVEILAGLISIFIGTYNYSMCEVQPLIPLYLILSGSALILHGIVRTAKSIPKPTNQRTQRLRKTSLYPDLLMHGLEAIVLLYMLICVILGCVWVYGNRSRYVQFIVIMFEQDYCDQTLFWTAWCMDQYVNQAKIRRIVNREWPEPSASSDPPSPPACGDGAPDSGIDSARSPALIRPVMRTKHVFETTSAHDARFDAANLFFETVTKKGIPTWMAYIMAFDFVKKYEGQLNLGKVEWQKSVYERVTNKFTDNVIRRTNDYMHGVRANENLIPEYPRALANFEYSLSSSIGSRRSMEDRDAKKDSLFAVFDGHNGPFSAMYAAAHLVESFLDEDDDPLATMDYALRSYYRTNSRLRQRSMNENVKSGTTAAITFIRNNVIHMLWVGDSPIMMLNKDGVSTHSFKHVPDSEDEYKRITEAEGFVSNGRVNNVLNISRAMGEMLAEELIIPTPDVKEHKIQEDDYALILCSDGITDALDENDIFQLLKNHAKSNLGYDQVADLIRRQAEENSSDNITILVIFLKPYAEFVQAFGQD
ncbi:unnamed protein product [Bursaphelenchus okinawaensis]|uniref:PPM-type phosphatase domain-containing protein n=1 Tax=Bursaphelenchus okinawaensis TaxID=465554 RepID=A0A811KNM0_9BILA|nr:unnamed protein product [Bursaphelenchus okinawaensis]CAG9108470.1 unnamed protein product [Bursaphelenchus okinawaensis]